MIIMRNITKQFGNLQVLKGIDVHIGEREVVSIVGPSGAGKTTLLQIMGTLSLPDGGDITINNTPINQLQGNRLAAFRNKQIGFVFQFHHLLPEFTALENVCIPAYIAKEGKASAEKRARELLDYLNLTDRMQHKPSQMSGGEQQRVAVARALINNPSIILADEPSGNLDSHNRDELHKLFFRLRDEMKQSIVIVTHDEGLADMSDRKLEMHDGLITSS